MSGVSLAVWDSRVLFITRSYRQKNTTRECTGLLEVLVFDELHDDVLLGLDLQHLQRQAQEWRGLDVPAVDAPHVLQLHGLVHHQLGCEGKNSPSGGEGRLLTSPHNPSQPPQSPQARPAVPVRPKHSSFQYLDS